jgi:hypothetical protein
MVRSPQELPDSVVFDNVEPLDSIEADLYSILEVPDSVALDNMKSPDSVEVVPDSVEEVPESIEEVVDSITLDNVEPPDSVDEVSDSVALDNVEPLDSVDEVPDSVEEVQCPCYGTFHGGVFGEACFQACHNARRCARCGLLHVDYDVPVKFLRGMDKFDCEFFIPEVEKLEMHGNTIILSDEVVKKLEERPKKRKQTKIHP